LRHLSVELADNAGNTRTVVGWDVQYYRTSWIYGGANHVVDTAAEADQVAAAYQSATSNTAAQTVMQGLNPQAQSLVDAALRRTISDGVLVLDVDEAKVYNYASSQLRYLPYSVGVSLGANQNAAKRMTHSSLSGFSHGADIGNYNTSWNYGGANRAVDTAGEKIAVANAMALAADGELGPLLSGLSAPDLAVMMAWRGDQSTWSDGSSVDDSDVAPSDPSASIRAHWGWFHVVRDWSDARALSKQRYLEDTAMSQATAGIVFGLTGDVPGIVITSLTGLGSQLLAIKISRAREDADGRGVHVEVGFRCENVPALPDPCWPVVSIKPR
jgi:hypothetical protein